MIKSITYPQRHRLELENLAKNKDIKIMKADKGGSVVIMNSDNYLFKAHQLLSDENTYTKLPSLPSVTKLQMDFNREVRKIAKSIVNVEQRNLVLSKISHKIPSLPYFYGVPKAHKPGCPLRPIVATCNAPQSKLAQYLATQLSPLLGKISDAHLLHSLDFIDRIKQLGNVEGRMISLDVTALFTNVPLEYLLSKLKNKFEEGVIEFSLPIAPLLDLIRLCVSSTIFAFNDEGFKQNFGVAMGSPLSPILANLCMEFLETDIMAMCPQHIKPTLWVRYVDDIFLVYKWSDAHFQEFFRYVNSFLPSIQFTVEHEVDNVLPFLDVAVCHDPTNHLFKFSVHRKPTNAENYIHFFSFHSPQVKSNVIVNFVIRAYRICDPEYIDKEISHLKRIFLKLCYPEHFIEKAITKARKRFFIPSPPQVHHKDSKFLSVPYHPNLEALQRKFNARSKGQVSIVFNYNNTIRSKLTHNKVGKVVNNKVGVYQVPCKDCDKSYFGETGRGLNIRLKEHQRSYELMANNNVLVRHSFDEDHMINWEGTKLLFKSRDIGDRRVVEGALIHYANSMEGNKSFTQEDPLINYLICNSIIKSSDLNTPHIATPDAASLSPAQVTELQNAPPVAGADADERGPINLLNSPIRRSRRLAGLPAEDAIT